MTSSFVPFSLLSGAFGALASCLAKFAFSTDTFLTTSILEGCNDKQYCYLLVYSARGLCFVGTLALNIFMVGSFLEGMEESGSIAGTAMSTAANFVVSSALGFLLWEEEFSRTWLMGFLCVVVGTILLSTVHVEETPAEKEKEE
ncbi:expressed unknown protein [Seminavis robusta]|uniref:EamA domain-containing protein n=1 Tax=Seminavis robusta TaxID=568900 RepID=A0A9N8HNA0_9STRA|nr:expressed unknown protein [Seminavis robusta]|eukprot:Sro969_g226180.1 n/a (144) ;mRNA; f:12537-12968